MTAEEFDTQVSAPKRREYWELIKEKEDLEKNLQPNYNDYNTLSIEIEKLEAQRKEMSKRIKRKEEPLILVKKKLAQLARELFKVGERPSDL